MKSLCTSFDALEIVQAVPSKHERTSDHVMFDVKIDFNHEAMWVLDGHRHLSPEGYVHAGVVSRESIKVAFTHAFLNNADVWACGVLTPAFKIPLMKSIASSVVKILV